MRNSAISTAEFPRRRTKAIIQPKRPKPRGHFCQDSSCACLRSVQTLGSIKEQFFIRVFRSGFEIRLNWRQREGVYLCVRSFNAARVIDDVSGKAGVTRNKEALCAANFNLILVAESRKLFLQIRLILETVKVALSSMLILRL